MPITLRSMTSRPLTRCKKCDDFWLSSTESFPTMYNMNDFATIIFSRFYTLTWYIAFLVSISRSNRAIFKFRKLRSLLEIAQNILIVHPFDKWGWGFVLMGECLGLNLYRQQWEAGCNFTLRNNTMAESLGP